MTRHRFQLLVEKSVPGCGGGNSGSSGRFAGEPDSPASYPSLTALAARRNLLHPFFRLVFFFTLIVDSVGFRM